MATTENTFNGDGSTGPFPFTFEYIEQSDVKVSIDGVTQATTEYTFPTATSIQFTSKTPSASELIRVFRDTDIDTLKATFFAGSSIKAEDLNDNFTQNNFAVQEIVNNTWDKETDTIHSDETWVSNDTQIATTAAIEAQFFNDTTETIQSGEAWPNNDTTIATTAAIDDYIDNVITNDIGTDGTGITVTDDGDGTITLGLADDTIDFDKIKDADQIQLADQVADPDVVGTDNNLFTAQALTRRFNNYYQNVAPATTDGVGAGQVWVDPDDDLTLSVWSGSAWVGITSGGTFTNQPKVVYVDATSGDDTNDGHRISRPKQTIKAAINQINGDATYGDGSVVIVAAGVYQEAAPIQIQKKNVSIIGQALRSCIVHPTQATETNTLFELNSGSYVANLTLTGVKASGARGAAGSLYTDATHGLPPTQGWNFAFFAGATITKSPYIQNCTNFSDSGIDNSDLNFISPGGGFAGDTTSAVTGGGLLVDGSTVAADSPLRSMVADSYTHVGLNGPGIFVTNNGYAQITSSYAFFNHFHIACLNGGQANLAASTTDFGTFSLIADGQSPNAIFTSNVDGAAADLDTTFNINQPTAGTDLYGGGEAWFGDTTRPQDNMLVSVNGVTYPVLSAVANVDSEGGNGWTVTISRPDPNDTATNLGLDGAVADDAAVSFFLRSMIASSGHTMEYVGSGTNYNALPENGGVPIENNQVVERNNGKVWSAITDHRGTFKLGDFFTVNQSTGTLSVNSGSFQVNLETLDLDNSGNAVFGAPLDMGANQITSSSGDLKLAANGDIDVQTNKIKNVVNPTDNQDAATKNYADTKAETDRFHFEPATQNADPAPNSITVAVGRDPDGSGTNHLGISYTTNGNPANDVNDNTVPAHGSSASIFTSNGDINILAGGGFQTSDGGTPYWENISFRTRSNAGSFESITIEGYHTGAEVVFNGTGAIRVPVGTDAQRPAGGNGPAAEQGQIRYSTTNSGFEGFNGISWGSLGGGATGGGADQVFVENDQTVTTDYEISANKNAMSAGPITINNGVVVEIPSGSTWVIV